MYVGNRVLLSVTDTTTAKLNIVCKALNESSSALSLKYFPLYWTNSILLDSSLNVTSPEVFSNSLLPLATWD